MMNKICKHTDLITILLLSLFLFGCSGTYVMSSTDDTKHVKQELKQELVYKRERGGYLVGFLFSGGHKTAALYCVHDVVYIRSLGGAPASFIMLRNVADKPVACKEYMKHTREMNENSVFDADDNLVGTTPGYMEAPLRR